jgi:hypothetical protein
MRAAEIKEREPFILHDRVLLSALLFGSTGYIVIGSWVGAAFLVAGFMMAAVWAFRTAGSHPKRGIRLMAALLLMTLGTFMTMYVAVNQGVAK